MYVHKQDFALVNLQQLIYHKTQPNQPISGYKSDKRHLKKFREYSSQSIVNITTKMSIAVCNVWKIVIVFCFFLFFF